MGQKPLPFQRFSAHERSQFLGRASSALRSGFIPFQFIRKGKEFEAGKSSRYKNIVVFISTSIKFKKHKKKKLFLNWIYNQSVKQRQNYRNGH
jgi:hypothetical protein